MKTFAQINNRSFVASSFLALITLLPAVAEDINVPVDFPTIQAAVDAASSGDTIHIAPGVYVEQIGITDKNLTLNGLAGAVIRASGALVPTTPHHCTVYVLGIVRSDVVVQGLTFEGEHLADGFECSYGGILFDGSSGRVKDCTVRGFRQADRLSGNNGFGLAADNYEVAGSPLNIQVLHCNFADNGQSIHVRGSDGVNDPVRLTFTIADNIITGIGSTTLGTQTGILISAGASGEVLRNTISGHSFADATGTSFGIFAVDWLFQFGNRLRPIALKPVRYEGNTFRDNQRHLASALGHGSQFVNNTFQGGSLAPFAGGLALTGNTNRVVGNHFSDMSTGITLVGDDPDFHTTYGIATNTTLLNNRFCTVTTPIVIEPLVTGTTNQGTLECPFPPPKLTIAPAVLISWPSHEGEWILESAPTVAGPWESTGITPNLQGGQNTVAVKTDEQHRFFRLTAD